MKKTIFAISDIHSFYKETIESLAKLGYDEGNQNHLLIVCGDIFSRGPDTVVTYEWLKRLTDEGKAIVLAGNHDRDMTIPYLEGTSISGFNWLHNGEKETFDDLTHRTASFESWCSLEGNCEMNDESFAKWIEIARKEINEEYPELLPWLKSLPYYYETKNYIFTHGMIQGDCPDWHNPTIGWRNCLWARPSDFNNPIVNTKKRIIIGHINSGLLRSLYGYDENDNSIFTRPDGKVIGLDTCTVITHEVNVLALEDELND